VDNWKLKIDSMDCPYKVYPTHTIHTNWQKGYCKIIFKEQEKDIECRCENCPFRVR